MAQAKRTVPTDAVIDAASGLVGDARDVVVPLSKQAVKELRKLEQKLVAATEVEAKRLEPARRRAGGQGRQAGRQATPAGGRGRRRGRRAGRADRRGRERRPPARWRPPVAGGGSGGGHAAGAAAGAAGQAAGAAAGAAGSAAGAAAGAAGQSGQRRRRRREGRRVSGGQGGRGGLADQVDAPRGRGSPKPRRSPRRHAKSRDPKTATAKAAATKPGAEDRDDQVDAGQGRAATASREGDGPQARRQDGRERRPKPPTASREVDRRREAGRAAEAGEPPPAIEAATAAEAADAAQARRGRLIAVAACRPSSAPRSTSGRTRSTCSSRRSPTIG